MGFSDFFGKYRKHVGRLMGGGAHDRAMSLAVGGDFVGVGQLEYYLLLQQGLKQRHAVVDVGCGSGRLAVQLKDYLEGLYVGIDVVTELHQHAKKLCNRPEWIFADAPGLTIPRPDASADFICFFSVFTHITHEETYRYLEDAKRVLKPDGRIVFSFIEFRLPGHWQFFQHALAGKRTDDVLNVFVSRDGIEAWAAHLGLDVAGIYDGDDRHIPLPLPVRLDNGVTFEGKGYFGQSVCVLTKPTR